MKLKLYECLLGKNSILKYFGEIILGAKISREKLERLLNRYVTSKLEILELYTLTGMQVLSGHLVAFVPSSLPSSLQGVLG